MRGFYKKTALLALLLLLVTGVSACGGKEEVDQGGNEKTPKEEPKKNEQTLPEGWETNIYTAWIDGVWDSSVLPSCFPKEVPGIKVESTTYKRSTDENMSSNNDVGSMMFEDDTFEEYAVGFYGNQDAFDALVAQLDAGTMVGGRTGTMMYEYAGDGYYLYLNGRETIGQDEYQYICTIAATPAIHKLPKRFLDTELSQAGIALESMDSFYMEFINGEYGENVYDLSKEGKDIDLSKDFCARFINFGVTIEDCRKQTERMQEAGWKVVYCTEEESDYQCTMERDGIYSACLYNYDGDYTMQTVFASISELIYY